jgi:HlyD family secretion protein
MDRPIDTAEIGRRIRQRALLGGLALAGLSLAFGWGPTLLRPTLRRSAIRTAVVDRGFVEATVSASGTVMPEVEKVLASPADARVLRVVKHAGDPVKRGDVIVELDLSQQILEEQRLDQGLALKLNQQKQKKLDLEERLAGLGNQADIKGLQLQALAEQLARSRALHGEGLLSDETLRQAELAHDQAVLELRKIQGERAIAERATRLQLEGLDLETAMLHKERQEAARQLQLASAQADRDGVVTWTVQEEGAALRRGDVIARVADLSSYRVDATVSDVHASHLSAGLPVTVRVGDEGLSGTIASVAPTVQNGVITLAVALVERSSPLLRPHLRVDVFVVTDRREDALRLKVGPFLNGAGPQDVFVVKGDRLLKTPVQIGIVGFERCEVQRGLFAGDEIVISDMRDYAHATQLQLR